MLLFSCFSFVLWGFFLIVFHNALPRPHRQSIRKCFFLKQTESKQRETLAKRSGRHRFFKGYSRYKLLLQWCYYIYTIPWEHRKSEYGTAFVNSTAIQLTFPWCTALTVLAAVVFMTWYMFTCIHTFTDCRASWPRFIELTNTLLGTLQMESGQACKGTTSIVFKGLRRANASGRVCIWYDQNRAPDDCRISKWTHRK